MNAAKFAEITIALETAEKAREIVLLDESTSVEAAAEVAAIKKLHAALAGVNYFVEIDKSMQSRIERCYLPGAEQHLQLCLAAEAANAGDIAGAMRHGQNAGVVGKL